MNTIRSTWIGWGGLCLAGGGAYYFAKQSINADRAARYEAEVRRKAQLKTIEVEHRQQAAMNAPSANPSDGVGLKHSNMTQSQDAGLSRPPHLEPKPETIRHGYE